MEIPLDPIKQVQISLRRYANLHSYDPHDPSFADLPSAEKAVAVLDRAEGRPRCRHCDGALLRGSKSSICVFCAGEPFDGVVPEPINFRNTVGFRWLLESLGLDGSEIVPVSVEENKKNRGLTATSNEIPLFDLLDLEIKWPSELEKFGSRLSSEKKPIQSKASVSSSGARYDASVETKESIQGHNNLTLFESAQINEMENPKESIIVENNHNLFENAQPSKNAPLSTEDESNYSDSGWGADFQSAPSGGANLEAISFDPSADLSAHMDEVFGLAKDSSSNKKEGLTAIESASEAGDWFSDNSWNNPSSGLSGLPQEIKLDTSLDNGNLVENMKYSSTSTDVDWIQDTTWHGNSTEEHDKNADAGDDSFDDWNDFASSTTGQDPSNSSKQATVPTDDKTSKINLFSPLNQPHNIEFVGSLSQEDLFTGEFCSPDVSMEALDRTTDVYTKAGGNSDDVGTDVFAVETTSKPDDVETILSQMHDLSFMLDSNLSIPPTREGTSSLSRD